MERSDWDGPIEKYTFVVYILLLQFVLLGLSSEYLQNLFFKDCVLLTADYNFLKFKNKV